jgi:hypothetical protein
MGVLDDHILGELNPMASQFLDVIFKPEPEDVAALNGNIKRLRMEQENGERRPDHAFQLATALISHVDRTLIKEGVDLLEALSFEYWQKARTEQPAHPGDAKSRESGTARLTESCFYLAIGHAKLNDIVKARSSVEKMLALAPGHPQGLALRERLEGELFQSGVKGLVGLSAAIVGVGIVYGLLRGRGSR